MKYLVKIFVVTFLSLVCTHTWAEQNIAYLDMKYILNNSKAGKAAQDYLKNAATKDQKKNADTEKKLKKEENDLLSKKSSMTKEEYKAKSDELRKKVVGYQNQRRESFNAIAKKRADAKQQLLKTLEPIIENYIKENNVSVIIDKKFLVRANEELDITNNIVEKLNNKLPALDLK